MNKHSDWLLAANQNRWVMPFAPWWKRLPVIRNMRAAYLKFKVEQHYTAGVGIFGLRTGYDEWVIYGIWQGFERTECENV